jgi:hypothetical protein
LINPWWQDKTLESAERNGVLACRTQANENRLLGEFFLFISPFYLISNLERKELYEKII